MNIKKRNVYIGNQYHIISVRQKLGVDRARTTKNKLSSRNRSKQHIPIRSVWLGFKTKQVQKKYSDLQPTVDPDTRNI